MFLWIKAYLGTIAVALVILGIVAAIIIKMISNKKKGRSSCGCGCQGCALRDSCHKSSES